jgi:hypothetical protein
VKVLAYLIPLVVFALLYEWLRRRAAVDGRKPAVQWGWIAAIVGCAAAAALAGLLL